jgi:hypothetical protein
MCLLRFASILSALLIVAGLPAKDSIRQIDFKNFTYPWDDDPNPLDEWHWISSISTTKVTLSGGVHRFWDEVEDGEDRDRAPGLWMQSVTYGDLDGDQKEEAAVDLNYSGGGTANWDYLYVFKLEKGVPRLLGWLESGSRAYGGLVKVTIQDNELLLDFADSQRRMGDCCSEGFIRVRYIWRGGQFVETGTREKGDLQIHISSGPPEEIGPRFTRGTSGDSIEDGVDLGFTVYKAADGVSLTVVYNDFDGASQASAFFEKELVRAAKVLSRGQKTDRDGKIVGERAEIHLAKPNEELNAVMWTDGRKFHEIQSTSLQDILALEKVYKY